MSYCHKMPKLYSLFFIVGVRSHVLVCPCPVPGHVLFLAFPCPALFFSPSRLSFSHRSPSPPLSHHPLSPLTLSLSHFCRSLSSSPLSLSPSPAFLSHLFALSHLFSPLSLLLSLSPSLSLSLSLSLAVSLPLYADAPTHKLTPTYTYIGIRIQTPATHSYHTVYHHFTFSLCCAITKAPSITN